MDGMEVAFYVMGYNTGLSEDNGSVSKQNVPKKYVKFYLKGFEDAILIAKHEVNEEIFSTEAESYYGQKTYIRGKARKLIAPSKDDER